MHPLDQILLKHGATQRTAPPEETPLPIAVSAGFPLPADYQYFLLHYHAFEGLIGEQFLRLESLEDLMEANEGYGVFEHLPRTLLIGSNGASEFIAIQFMEDTRGYRVVLSPYGDMDEQYHVKIGNTFSDFLARMDKGVPWFD